MFASPCRSPLPTQLFSALAKANVNVRATAQGASEYNITVVIDGRDSVRALKTVHAEFYSQGTPMGVGLVGPGLVGATLLKQLKSQIPQLRGTGGVDMRVLGIATSTRMLLSDTPIDLDSWEERFEKEAVDCDLARFGEHIKVSGYRGWAKHPSLSRSAVVSILTPHTPLVPLLPSHLPSRLCEHKRRPQTARTAWQNTSQIVQHRRPAPRSSQESFTNAVVVDCTASDAPPAMYTDWVRQGLHVVTPNKKMGSGELSRYKAFQEILEERGLTWHYETTVGAGLPVIYTLQHLVNTGDKIVRIEGIFSGTMSYLFNSMKPSDSFSEVVAGARAAGYTEPDPRDDLEGMDVARKVTILAREAGAAVELQNVEVQSLVPEELRDTSKVSVDELMKRLGDHDGEMRAMLEEADKNGEVLRYVGVADLAEGRCAAELKRYPKDHPFAALTGADNIIMFTTERYRNLPLIVRGPGAGAEVTAAGVFSDLLRLAHHLGATM